MRAKFNLIRTILIAVSFALLATLPAAAANPLYEVGSLASSARSPAVVEERNITVAPHQITKLTASLELELLNGVRVVATSDQATEVRGESQLTWRGLIDGAYRVTLTRDGSEVAGFFETEIGPHSIMPRGKEGHTLALLDQTLFGDCDTRGSVASPLSAVPFQGTADLAPDTKQPAGLNNLVNVTVLALYTPQARQEAGGDAQIRVQIQNAIDQGNSALGDSDSGLRFELVHTALANYSDSGFAQADIDWMESSQQVSNLRVQHEANLVGLVTATLDFCGLATSVLNNPNGDPAVAYQVTELSCANDNMTFVHELGHLIGMNHDPGQVDPGDAIFPFAFGHYDTGQFEAFKTIMTRRSTCLACPRVGRFSNPDVDFAGIPTGIEGERDNAQVADIMAPIIAEYREIPSGFPTLVSSYVPENGGPRRESSSASTNPPSFTFLYDEFLGNFYEQPGFACNQGHNNPTYLKIRYEGPQMASCAYQFSYGPNAPNTLIHPCSQGLVNYLNSHQPVLISTDVFEVDSDPSSPNFCGYVVPAIPRLGFNQPEWIRLDLTTTSGQSFSRQVNLIKAFVDTP